MFGVGRVEFSFTSSETKTAGQKHKKVVDMGNFPWYYSFRRRKMETVIKKRFEKIKKVLDKSRNIWYPKQVAVRKNCQER